MLIKRGGEFSLKKLILFEGFEKCAQFLKKRKEDHLQSPSSKRNQGHEEDWICKKAAAVTWIQHLSQHVPSTCWAHYIHGLTSSFQYIYAMAIILHFTLEILKFTV